VRAFSYVKGSEAHYKQVHLSLVRQAATTLRSRGVRCELAGERPVELRRYNVEPYHRVRSLVLAGACDLIAVKDRSRYARAARLQRGARHLLQVIVEPAGERSSSR